MPDTSHVNLPALPQNLASLLRTGDETASAVEKESTIAVEDLKTLAGHVSSGTQSVMETRNKLTILREKVTEIISEEVKVTSRIFSIQSSRNVTTRVLDHCPSLLIHPVLFLTRFLVCLQTCSVTGTTPARRNYEIPRSLVRTQPADLLQMKLQKKLDEASLEERLALDEGQSIILDVTASSERLDFESEEVSAA